jgi:hypothetical protein
VLLGRHNRNHCGNKELSHWKAPSHLKGHWKFKKGSQEMMLMSFFTISAPISEIGLN